MRPDPPQLAAPDENEAAPLELPALSWPEEPLQEDETSPAYGPHPVQLPGFTESAEGTRIPAASLEASEADHQERTGLRVMRASPVVLVFCGLVFVSLIFLLDFMTQTATTSARQSAATAEPTKQEPVAPAPVAPQPVAQTSAPTPEPKPSVEPEKQATPPPAPAPSPDPTPQVAAALPPDSSRPQSEEGFTLQIGSYNELAQAQERADKLGSFGVQAYVARVEIPKRGTWYRVQTGRFSSREEANRYGTQLRGKGAVADFIVTTSNKPVAR